VQGGLGTSTTLHARHLLGSQGIVWASAGHAARAACFLAFFIRLLGVLVKNGSRHP